MVGQQDSNVSKLIRARACTQTEALMETFASGPTKPSASISQVWPVAPPFGQIHIQRRLQNPGALVVAQNLTSNPHPCWLQWLWNKTSVPLWASLYSLQMDVHSDIGKSWKNTWNTSKVQLRSNGTATWHTAPSLATEPITGNHHLPHDWSRSASQRRVAAQGWQTILPNGSYVWDCLGMFGHVQWW